MNRNSLIAIVALFVILAVMVGGVVLPLMYRPLLIHGYDGPVATIVDIDAPDYGEGVNENYREVVTPTSASVYLAGLEPMGVFAPCGLRMEIQAAPNVIESETEVTDTLTRNVIDKVAKTNTTITVEVKRVRCDMTVVVFTYQGGLASCYGATFWIQVEENAYSIVSNADENIVWIEHIYTREPAVEQGSMEYDPTIGGSTFELTTVSRHPVPQWVLDSGYQPAGELFEVVKFPIRILSGCPSYTFPNIRTESSVEFDIGFDCILIGEWKNVHPYLEGGLPDPPDLLGDLIAFLTLFAWVVLGFIATILVFRFVPDWRMKLLATGIVWAVLIILFGIDAIQIWLGGG